MRIHRWLIASALALVPIAEARAQATAAPSGSISYPLWEFGTMPNQSFKDDLLDRAAVQEELKLTPAQVERIKARVAEEFEAINKVRREVADAEKSAAAESRTAREAHVAIMEVLEPAQRDRLDQIQLRSQGPFAFNRSKIGIVAYEGPALAERLKLTDDQARRVTEIAEAGDREIEQAATITVFLDPLIARDRGQALAAVRTPEFRASKQKARAAAREAWAAVMGRIEAALTGPQLEAYRAMLGPPFDVATIGLDGQSFSRSKTNARPDESFADASLLETALQGKLRRK